MINEQFKNAFDVWVFGTTVMGRTGNIWTWTMPCQSRNKYHLNKTCVNITATYLSNIHTGLSFNIQGLDGSIYKWAPTIPAHKTQGGLFKYL